MKLTGWCTAWWSWQQCTAWWSWQQCTAWWSWQMKQGLAYNLMKLTQYRAAWWRWQGPVQLDRAERMVYNWFTGMWPSVSGALLLQLLDGVFQCLPFVAEPHADHFTIVVQPFWQFCHLSACKHTLAHTCIHTHRHTHIHTQTDDFIKVSFHFILTTNAKTIQ